MSIVSVYPGNYTPGAQTALEMTASVINATWEQLAMQQPEQEPFALAESGVVAAQAQADRMCKEYKVGCDTVRPPAAPAPVQQAAPAPVAKPQGIIGLLKGRQAQIDKAVDGYAKSGVVQGEGTRTSDSVPAVVGEGDEKQKLALSKGEGLLVVSNNTMDNPQAMDAIRQILADSNGGKEPKMPDQGLRAGVQKAAASGFFPAQQGYMAQVEAGKREVAGPPAPSARVLQPDEAAALKEKVLTGEVVSSMNRDDKSPQEISQGSVGNTFVADGIKPGLRSGAVSNMQPDPNVKYGTTMVDATQLEAPNGGGYITGSPMHANGLRRAIEVAPSAAPARDPNGEYDVHGNNMAYTNQMKKQLAEMQKDRIERTAAMPGATRGDMVALATQMRNDQLASVNAKAAADSGTRREELWLRKQALDQQRELALLQQEALQQQREAASREAGVKNMTDLVAASGYKDAEQKAYADYINANHAKELSGLSHADQLAMEPILRAQYEDHKARNANTTNGRTTIKNLRKTGEAKLDTELDAADDPNGWFEKKVLFGDGSDGKGLGKVNILARRHLPDVFFGSDTVDVYGGKGLRGNEGGQRVMRKDVGGKRGPLESGDMYDMRAEELKRVQRGK